ncbi:MAG TPA: hypothetical protein VHK69_15560, partial [Chitinophagaceae bacterium]|nr:hypothetical protein [Chitinophagaceae bacterium]
PVRAEGTFSFLPDTTLLAYTRPAYEQATFRFRLLLYKKHPPQPDFSGAHAAINPYLSRKDRKFLKLDPLSPQELYEEAMRLHKQSIEPDLTQAARKDLARRAKTILDTLNRREPLNEEYFYGWKQVKRNLYYTLDSNWGAYAQEVKRNIERTNGFLQHFAGDTAKIREYRRVLSSDYGSLSFYLVFSGRPPEVIAMAQEGLRIDPTNDFIYTNLALGYLLNKEFAKAKEEYRRLKGKYYRDSGRNFVPVFLKDFDLLEWWGVIDRNKDREIYDFAQRVRCWLQDEKKCSLD